VPGGNLCAPRIITYASTTQGRISQSGGVGCYLLDGVAGDRVRLRAASITPGFTASVSVAGAHGTFCTGSLPTCTLPETRRYSITVSGTGTGYYELSAQRVGNPIGCAPLNLGNTPAPTTLVAGGQPCYRIAGVSGMRLRLRLVQLTGANDLVAEVLGPNGTTICADTRVDDSTCVLSTGPHTVLDYDRAPVVTAGSYALEARRLDDPGWCPSLAFGALPKYESLPVAASDCYRVDVAAGDALRVRMRTEGQLKPHWEVLRPDGTTLCSALTEMWTCRADTAGAHTVLVRDAYPGTRSGTYQVSVQRLNDPVGCTAGWLSPDATRAEISVGQTHCLRLVAFAGDRLRARLVAGSPVQDAEYEIVRPDGTTRCGRYLQDCVLDATGAHHILVHDRSQAGFGVYWWSLQRLDHPAECSTLTRGAAPVIEPLAVAATPCWRFHGTAGERISFALNKQSGDFEPHMELLKPDGRWMSRSSTTGTGIHTTKTLPVTGWYTLLVRDGGRGIDTGVYDLAVD
jgi:hypothetical protein